MTNTLMGMLAAARALHERAEYSPGDCLTCSTGDRYMAWPCDTAKALGATGLSEWLPISPAPACEHTNPNYQIDYPCALPEGHPPVLPNGHRTHIDKDGDTW